MSDPSPQIVPVILSGGSGTRLWPMSTPATPKQFLPLAGAATMFEATLERCSDRTMFADPLIVANARHADLIEAQLAGRPATLLLEPLARNTAPAIALAALAVPRDAPLLVMPSDHVIGDVAAFHAAVAAAIDTVGAGWLVTFGISADAPETGYGYIQVGSAVAEGVHRVTRFVEKPDLARATDMLASGDYVWNGGIFLFRAGDFLDALATHAPTILMATRAAMGGAKRAGRHILPDADAFAASPSDSIDYAVMEKADRVAVVPVAMGWSDVGSWDALFALGRNADGHAHHGNVIAVDTQRCLIRSDGIRIAAVGVEDLIVVASGNDILILPRGRSQDVRHVVEALKQR